MADQLKAKKDAYAEIVIDFGNFKAELPNCRIFSNNSGEDDVVFIAQDVNDPNKKVQVTIRRVKEQA